MKCAIVFSSFLMIANICMSRATELFYVLPDNSTNDSCPSQPCATLSQYWLHNGTLPVVSNVEYHFLPGEHHVPANMLLQNLYNFSIIGAVNISSPTILVGCSQYYVINIANSQFVTIANVMFKQCDILKKMTTYLTNLKLFCCFSCKVENAKFFQYGFHGYNLIGHSFLNNIKIEITQFSKVCCQMILLQQSSFPCSPWSKYYNHVHNITINQLLIKNYTKCNTYRNAGLLLDLDYALYHVNLLLVNSTFSYMDRTALNIYSRCSSVTKRILVTNCTFTNFHEANSAIHIIASPVNQNIKFVNCKFYSIKTDLIKIDVALPPNFLECILHPNHTLSVINISFMGCRFCNNSQRLLIIENDVATADKANVLLESLHISRNNKLVNPSDDLISISNVNIHVNRLFNIMKNHAKLSILKFKSCDIIFSGKIMFDANYCNQVILLDTHIKVLEHSNITFTNNKYLNKLIAVENTKEYAQPYPFCLFQYIVKNGRGATKDLLIHYVVIANQNYKYSSNFKMRLPSQNDSCSLSFYHFTSHCKWLPSASFYDYSPEVINEQIIQNDDQNCNYHKHICYCSMTKGINCSIDILGVVYPGQTLESNLCNMCSSNVSTVLYAEVHNTNLPNSTCKIAHYSQLINIIGNHSSTVNYTIVSNTPNIDRCELFLTASPFLNIIYNAFYVQLLPCPVGFTLQDGICDCDPILSEYIDKCYIDYSAVRRPANTWITALKQALNNDKYLISDCPMDYCLPYSSNVNLQYPDVQCQFNRTGILCSQCQQHLSMIFGSSRCVECTNIHILIFIIVIVAGIVLVILLYLLNLTVTVGTINGIILYVNVVSINDSVFLVNNNVFKPLKIFISFVNLDLGIESCFYNGMDSYAQMWLQLFFPFYLMIIAISVIIVSRYSSRILRLTYSRSLPVLATLFLLSYTGVLRTVLTVLFSYSTITHLPSGHKQIVWSIDASVPLFGLKFTILFITCLVLFLLLIPFNIVLLFTRRLLQYKIINRFKPLLDAFQGSHKDRYYYWGAIHISLRSLFFSLYGLTVVQRLVVSTFILILSAICYSRIYPYKNKMVNIQELFLLMNLIIMYTVSYQGSESTFSIVTNVMISLAFIQFCIIVLYHFLIHTCHYNVVIMLQTAKQKVMKYFNMKKSRFQNLNDLQMLNIPECTYNYNEYQDGLISDDFK